MEFRRHRSLQKRNAGNAQERTAHRNTKSAMLSGSLTLVVARDVSRAGRVASRAARVASRVARVASGADRDANASSAAVTSVAEILATNDLYIVL